MNWFKKEKKEKMLGNYVKYSLDTAKHNPDMIFREYDRILTEKLKNISEALNPDYCTYLDNVCDTVDIKTNLYEQGTVSVSVSYKKGKDLLKFLDNYKIEQLFDNYLKYKEIKKEREVFRKKYAKW